LNRRLTSLPARQRADVHRIMLVGDHRVL
jgi:hypothetical protein